MRIECLDRAFAACFQMIAATLLFALYAVFAVPTAQARFLSPDTWDPIISEVDINRYSYSGNDPVNGSDPNGHDILSNLGYGGSFMQQFERVMKNDPAVRSAPENLAAIGEAAKDVVPGGEFVDAYRAGKEGRYLAVAGNGVLGAVDVGTTIATEGVATVAKPVVREAFSSFKALKKAWGPIIKDNNLHHIVEQCQGKCTRSGFPASLINSKGNVVEIPKAVNQALADIYASKQSFTGNKTLRDWLSGKSLKEQYEYGKKYLKQELEKYKKGKHEKYEKDSKD
jgi:hypothetical protein